MKKIYTYEPIPPKLSKWQKFLVSLTTTPIRYSYRIYCNGEYFHTLKHWEFSYLTLTMKLLNKTGEVSNE